MTPDEAAVVVRREYQRMAEEHLDTDSPDDRLRTALFRILAERERLLADLEIAESKRSAWIKSKSDDVERLREALESYKRIVATGTRQYATAVQIVLRYVDPLDVFPEDRATVEELQAEARAALAGEAQP